jgi:hypothetical protein
MAREGRDTTKREPIKAFAVANMGGHWGAVCVDFVGKRILFGHSLDHGDLPSRDTSEFRAAAYWLNECGVPTERWTYERFNVAQQNGSGSCGINAANAIERSLEPSVELWTGERSRFHRMRFLKLLIEVKFRCMMTYFV